MRVMGSLQVPIETMFGAGVHSVVSKLNVEGQHRGAVAAAKMSAANVAAADAAEVKQEHGHGHGHAHAGHGHGHDGGKKHSHEDGLKHEDCGECKEEGHDHVKHEHKHEHHHHHHSHAGEEADCKVGRVQVLVWIAELIATVWTSTGEGLGSVTVAHFCTWPVGFEVQALESVFISALFEVQVWESVSRSRLVTRARKRGQ